VSLLVLLGAALPCLYWTPGIDTAPALKRAGIERVCVPPADVEAWRKEGFTASATSPDDLIARPELQPPGVTMRPELVSATRAPWLNANGWRFLRAGGGAYLYTLPRGKAALAAAEAFAYGIDALLKIDPGDAEAAGRMLAFEHQLPDLDLPPVADFAVVDDKSVALGEILNLLVRRNLLFRVVQTPDASVPLNVALGTKEYTLKDATDPNAIALKVRRQLGDERRTLRLYGVETVIARLLGDDKRLRLHLLNYGGRVVDGLRIRVRGDYPEAAAFVEGQGRVTLEDRTRSEGATEFSLPSLGVYAVVDLAAVHLDAAPAAPAPRKEEGRVDPGQPRQAAPARLDP
jgi:hypothetical protein